MKIIKSLIGKFLFNHYHAVIEKINKNCYGVDHEITYWLAKSVHSLEGDMAELGVLKGISAKIILEAEKEKTLHLFDTWKGFPEVSEIDFPQCKGQFYNELKDIGDIKEHLFEDTKKRLSKYPNVRFYRGVFPETTEPVRDKKFAFVNLDADLYLSMLNGLKFFYPRMAKGGIIAIHDYFIWAGTKKAVDEFLQDKPEILISVYKNRIIIVKN